MKWLMMTPLTDLKVHHLRFTLKAQSILRLGAQVGGQIRGALWVALKSFACTDPKLKSDPVHQMHCPMCRLVARETDQGRGVNPARPFAIQPPLKAVHDDGLFLNADETFSIGVSLFGDVADLFPYVVHAVYRMGQGGLGYGRGTFTIAEAVAINPLTSTTQQLLSNGKIVCHPDIPVTTTQIEQAAASLPSDAITLRFLTPAQIVAKGKSMPNPVFAVLIGRLVERCQSIQQTYGADNTTDWRELYLSLTDSAQQIECRLDHTRWLALRTGSRRTNSSNTMSGFVGSATFAGDLKPFHEWLLWGQSLHIGKNAVKGNGWYEVIP